MTTNLKPLTPSTAAPLSDISNRIVGLAVEDVPFSPRSCVQRFISGVRACTGTLNPKLSGLSAHALDSSP